MSKKLTLIANSGIQFHRVDVRLENTSPSMKLLNLYGEVVEENEIGIEERVFKFVHNYYGDYIDRDLINIEDAYDSKTNRIIDEKIHLDCIEYVEPENVYRIRGRDVLERFEGMWLPLPYFRTMFYDGGELKQGPETWARIWITKIPFSERKGSETHAIMFAFDTKCVENKFIDEEFGEPVYNTPGPRDADGTHYLCLNIQDKENFRFCERKWVQDWLSAEFDKRRKENERNDFKFNFLGYYLTFLNALHLADVFPTVSLHTDKSFVEVDLVLDVGNSRTCGLLLETNTEEVKKQPFDFNTATSLQIRELTRPHIVHKDAFPMKVAFLQANLGNDASVRDSGNQSAFQWPSLVRIGEEATRITTIYTEENKNSTMSSPKRYLWDEEKARFLWHYISTKQGGKSEFDITSTASNDFASYFTADGKFYPEIKDKKGILTAHGNYSRGSLMIFALAEIFLHAYIQINSHEFRSRRGKPTLPRRLRRIVLTCPTAMLKIERQRLRQHAVSAIKGLNHYFQEYVDKKLSVVDVIMEPLGVNSVKGRTKGIGQVKNVIPIPEEIGKEEPIDWVNELTDLDEDLLMEAQKYTENWGYDEATCTQLAFMYSEIMHRFQKDATLYFKTVGRVRNNLLYPIRSDIEKRYLNGEMSKRELKEFNKNEIQKEQPAVTIASVDIGGGTTDLMICSYQENPKAPISVLVPQPHFWEGFNLAGDDILKRVIEQIVLPVFQKRADELGCNDSLKIMRNLFGPISGQHEITERVMRQQFTNQIALPIAYEILNFATQNKGKEIKSFDDFFENYPMPNKRLMEYIEDHFNDAIFTEDNEIDDEFFLEELIWQLDVEGVNTVVKNVIEQMIMDLCGVIQQYDCDYVLLAGKPTTLPIIRELFLKYLPAPPDRIISMGDYRMGEWYPFANERGKIVDPKTCVAVGAAVALVAGKLNLLRGFRLDTTLLKYMIRSTADYIGAYDENSGKIKKLYFQREEPKSKDEVLSRRKEKELEKEEDIPEYDNIEIDFYGEMLIGMKQLPTANWRGTPMYKLSYSSNEAAERHSVFPIKLWLSRREGHKEKLEIRTGIYKSDFVCSLQTLPKEYGYWMDTGEFTVDI